jgi:hypothetical protein
MYHLGNKQPKDALQRNMSIPNHPCVIIKDPNVADEAGLPTLVQAMLEVLLTSCSTTTRMDHFSCSLYIPAQLRNEYTVNIIITGDLSL